MKLIKRPLLTVILTGFLLFNVATATHGFRWSRSSTDKLTILLHKIDKPEWVIGYRFADDCPAEFRAKAADLEKLITDILRAWLEPLHEMYPERQITDDFRFILGEDFRRGFAPGLREEILKSDMYILFFAERGRSDMGFGIGNLPGINMRDGTEINARLAGTLAHEIGHAFGLADTYVDPDKPREKVSTGGLAGTVGKQPASRMNGPPSRGKFGIGEDDRRGIIYLYKYLYEGQPFEDCFFFDYVFEDLGEWTPACRPKHPLIFEVKHSYALVTDLIFRDDPTLDVNERDAGGFTALHHAVMRGDADIVTALLTRDDIKVNILSKDTRNRTPAQLAREFELLNIAKLIEAHPSAKLRPWSVSPGGKLTTTWGHLKQQD